MSSLSYSTGARYPAPPTAVWEQAIRVEHLDALTPSWLRFRPIPPVPRALDPGALIDYRLHWHHLPMHWTTEVLEHDYPRHFAYRQARGPYRRFVHDHHFAVDPNDPQATVTTETIELDLFGGAVARLLLWPLVRRDLDRLYAFRHPTLAHRLGVSWAPWP